jgi:hypothetical protein
VKFKNAGARQKKALPLEYFPDGVLKEKNKE